MNRLTSLGVTANSILNSLNMGLIVLDEDFNILLWNDWMARHSGISGEQALDQDFVTLFKQQLAPGFMRALSDTIRYGLPAVLSSALHRSPLPLYPRHAVGHKGASARLIQSVLMTPIHTDAGKRACLIQICDTSHTVKRENVLLSYSETLKRQATTDALTGLNNRGFFDENFALAVQRACYRQETLAVLMIDVDYFKQYNDCYGHAAGDHALKRVAAVLKAQLRSATDILARYGGEEFVMLVEGVDAGKVGEIAERIRESVQAMQMPHERSMVSAFLTISIGVYAGVPQSEMKMRPMIEAADAALYRAKQQGRNRVVVAGEVNGTG